MIRIVERLGVRKRADDLEILHGLLELSPKMRLLDVGGGAGTATERFSRGSGEVTILEPDRRKVAVGQKQRPALRFQEGHGESIPSPDGYFDRVVAVVAFHHVDDQTLVLREMRRVLRTSGRIVLAELPPARAPSCLARWIGGRHRGSSMSFLEPPELEAMLRATGFVDVATHTGVTCYFVTATK